MLDDVILVVGKSILHTTTTDLEKVLEVQYSITSGCDVSDAFDRVDIQVI